MLKDVPREETSLKPSFCGVFRKRSSANYIGSDKKKENLPDVKLGTASIERVKGVRNLKGGRPYLVFD